MKKRGLWGVLTFIIMEVFIGFFWGEAHAAASTFGSAAATITSSIAAIAQLITASAYVAGIGFVMGAILKFKQHKDNPTQIPVGTPLSLLFIGAALLFLPSILTLAGNSIFGTGSATTAGASGTAWGT